MSATSSSTPSSPSAPSEPPKSPLESEAKDESDYTKAGLLIRILYMRGLITMLVVIYAMCLIYICVYTLITLIIHLKNIGTLGNRIGLHDEFLQALLYNPKNIFRILAMILLWLAYGYVMFFTPIFLILWIIWIFLFIFQPILSSFEPFKECNNIGLFRLLDNLSSTLFSSSSGADKFKGSGMAFGGFFQQFFEKMFGVILPGSEIDYDYLKSMSALVENIGSSNLSMEEINKHRRVLQDKTPVVKVVVQNGTMPQPSLSDMEVISLNNCIKQNTCNLLIDGNTIEKLKIAHYNENVKQKCENKIHGKDADSMIKNEENNAAHTMHTASYSIGKEFNKISREIYVEKEMMKYNIYKNAGKLYIPDWNNLPPKYDEKPPDKHPVNHDEPSVLSQAIPKVTINYKNTSDNNAKS